MKVYYSVCAIIFLVTTILWAVVVALQYTTWNAFVLCANAAAFVVYTYLWSSE